MGQCMSYVPPAKFSDTLLQEAITTKDEEYMKSFFQLLETEALFRKCTAVQHELLPIVAKAVISASFKKEKDLTPVDLLLFKCMNQIADEPHNVHTICENEMKLIKKLVDNVTYRKDSVQVDSCSILAAISKTSIGCSKLTETTIQNYIQTTLKRNASGPQGELERHATMILAKLKEFRGEKEAKEAAVDASEADTEEEDIIIIGQNKSNALVINKLNEINAENRSKQLLLAKPSVRAGPSTAGQVTIHFNERGEMDMPDTAADPALFSPSDKYQPGLLTQALRRISPNNSPSLTENQDPNNGTLRSPSRRLSNKGLSVAAVYDTSAASTPTSATKPVKPAKPPRAAATPAPNRGEMSFHTPMTSMQLAPRDSAGYYSAAPTPSGPAFLAAIREAAPTAESDEDTPADPRKNLMAMLAKRGSGGDTPAMPLKKATAAPSAAAAGGVTYAEHPVYSKYFKMVKFGTPLEAVRLKMQQEKVDPRIIDKAPTDIVPPESAPTGPIAYKDHPKYEKYFKMVSKGVPPAAVKNSMVKDNIDPAILDKDPNEIVNEGSPEELVSLKEHPIYGKYFAMLAKGVPREGVEHRMLKDGENPAVLDRNASDKVGVGKIAPVAPANKAAAEASKSTVKKKKFHFNGVDPSRLQGNSLWAEKDEDDYAPKLDEQEFNMLFVEDPKKAIASPVMVDESSLKKKKKASLLDPKRAQNGNIALARFKVSTAEIRKSIERMRDADYKTDQFKALLEFLPTAEETAILSSYKGEIAILDTIEKYMITMLGFDTAAVRIKCLIYKRAHEGRLKEIRGNAAVIEKACDDIKMCKSLKKVMRTILHVGNQMNDAHKAGFSLDTLLKLKDTKALDQKTSLLLYVISVIRNSDESCLSFPDEIKGIGEAVRLPLEGILTDFAACKKEFEEAFKCYNKVLQAEQGNEMPAEYAETLKELETFYTSAAAEVKELGVFCTAVREKYDGVVAYFGEDAKIPSEEFFRTMNLFAMEFNSAKIALLKQTAAADKAKAKEAADLSKRASTNISSSAKKASPTKPPIGATTKKQIAASTDVKAARNSCRV